MVYIFNIIYVRIEKEFIHKVTWTYLRFLLPVISQTIVYHVIKSVYIYVYCSSSQGTAVRFSSGYYMFAYWDKLFNPQA